VDPRAIYLYEQKSHPWQTSPAIQILLPGPPGSGEFLAGREVKFGLPGSFFNIMYSLTLNPLQPPASMDTLFDTPSGPISHREVRAAVAEEISLVMYDPVVDAFRSLRQMSADEIAHFNPL